MQNRGADRHSGLYNQAALDCKVHGDRSSTAIHGGEAAVNDPHHRQNKGKIGDVHWIIGIIEAFSVGAISISMDVP